jgi:ribonuclease E
MFMRYVHQAVGHMHTTRTSTSSRDDMTVDTETVDACNTNDDFGGVGNDKFQDDEDKISEGDRDDDCSDDEDSNDEDSDEDSADDDDDSEDDLGPADGEDGGDGDVDEDDSYDSY